MFENFGETIFRTIYEYKKILKRHLPTGQYGKKIRDLGIKRKHLRDMSEIDLYKLLQVILNDLENYKRQDYPRLYSGIHEFINYIKSLLKYYHIEDKAIVHSSRTASQKIIDMIQLISANESFSDDLMQEVSLCLEKIMQYGTIEQVDMLINVLKQQANEKKELCDYLLSKLETHLKKMLQNPSPSLKAKT
jgi:hypothetical protein